MIASDECRRASRPVALWCSICIESERARLAYLAALRIPKTPAKTKGKR